MPGTQGDKVADPEQMGVIGVEFRKWLGEQGGGRLLRGLEPLLLWMWMEGMEVMNRAHS